MALSLADKISIPSQGVYLIGTTPPKAGTDSDKTRRIARKLLARLQEVEYDGLIIYDIQDESSRVQAERPFPFHSTLIHVNIASYSMNSLRWTSLPIKAWRSGTPASYSTG